MFNGRETDYFCLKLRDAIQNREKKRNSSFIAVPFQDKSPLSLFEEETLLCYLLPLKRRLFQEPGMTDIKPILALIANRLIRLPDFLDKAADAELKKLQPMSD